MWNKQEKLPFKIIINPSYDWAEDAKSMGVSHRELEVFALMMDGHSNREIAQILGIQYQSVKNHVFTLYKKLKVKNMGQAMFVLLFKNCIKTEIPILKTQNEINGEEWIQNTKKVLRDEDSTLDKKTKKYVRKFFLDHGLYGQIYEDRAAELKDNENE